MRNSLFHKNLLFAGLLLLFIFPSAVLAQKNAYGINDKLYDYFLKCETQKGNHLILNMSDTLYKKAEILHDTKAQCIALYYRVVYYMSKKNVSQFLKEKQRLSS